MRVLITGAGGYIGSVATYLFLQNSHIVLALDNFSTGYHSPLKLLQEKFGPEKLKIFETDLNNDLSEVFKERDIQAVIHFAANCQVDESMKQPNKYFQNNVCGSLNLINTMLKYDVKNIVFSSTCAVYGEAQHIPIDETHPTNPTNPYGASKRMVEQIIEWNSKLQGLNYVILRYFNICGASDDSLIGDSKKPSSLLVQNAVRGALGIQPFTLTCPEVDTPDRTPIRDYINVVDLNEAHLKALKYLLGGGKSDIINLGTGTGSSVLEIINQVKAVTGVEFKFDKTTPRAGEYAKAVADIKKAKEVLGWAPQRTTADSIKSLVAWYKSHPQGWDH